MEGQAGSRESRYWPIYVDYLDDPIEDLLSSNAYRDPFPKEGRKQPSFPTKLMKSTY